MIKLSDDDVKNIYYLTRKFLHNKNIFSNFDNSLLLEDAVQEIVIASYEKIERDFDENKSSLNTYIYQTVEFKVRSYKKKIAIESKKAEQNVDYYNSLNPLSLNTKINNDDKNEITLGDVVPDENDSPLSVLLRKELFEKIREILIDNNDYNLIYTWLTNNKLSYKEIGTIACFGNPSSPNYTQLVNMKIKTLVKKLSQNKDLIEILSNLNLK